MTTLSSLDPDVDHEDIDSGPRDALYYWWLLLQATLALESYEDPESWRGRTYTSPRITRGLLKERLRQINREKVYAGIPDAQQEIEPLDTLPELPRVSFSLEAGRFVLNQATSLSAAAGDIASATDHCLAIFKDDDEDAAAKKCCRSTG